MNIPDTNWPPAVGQALPRAEAAYGIEEKLRGHSLNDEHPVGMHKARVFRSALGITLEDVDHLIAELLVGVLQATIATVRDNAPHGLLCEVPVPVQGVKQAGLAIAITTTVWEYRSQECAPRLVSAYINP